MVELPPVGHYIQSIMGRRLSSLILALMVSACTGVGLKPVHVHVTPELLDGRVLFDHTVKPAPVMDLLSISPAMQAFIAEDVAKGGFSASRFRKLMTKLINNGFFINQYDRTATYSAAETFENRRGNCISYTNLFIALAREAGLDAHYQIMYVQPTWDVESGYLVRNNHVNVILDNIRMPGTEKGELTVDFNTVEPEPDARRKIISDAYAASMFYGNLAVKHLQAGEHEQSFAYLKRAILTDASNIDLWNNLGALYSILGENVLSEKAYSFARSLNPKDKTAISGLAKVLRKQGRQDEAQAYNRLADRYQRRNPYYHYALAEQAFQNSDFEMAVSAVNHAIDLKRNNARFYALRAAAAQRLGDEQLFAQSVRLQRRHARHEPDDMRPWYAPVR